MEESKELKERKRAIALEYDMEKNVAPKITASGQGDVAENIIKKAEENGVPIYEDSKLVKELLQFQVGTEIPPELYEIVAQVLVFVEELDAKKATRLKIME